MNGDPPDLGKQAHGLGATSRLGSRVGGALLLVLGVAILVGMVWAWPSGSLGGRGAGMVLVIGGIMVYAGGRTMLGR